MCGPFSGARGRTPAEGGWSDAAAGGIGSDDDAAGGDKAAPVGGSLSAEAEGGCGKPDRLVPWPASLGGVGSRSTGVSRSVAMAGDALGAEDEFALIGSLVLFLLQT